MRASLVNVLTQVCITAKHKARVRFTKKRPFVNGLGRAILMTTCVWTNAGEGGGRAQQREPDRRQRL